MIKKSINPITGAEYNLPSILDDKDNIDIFLNKNKNKKVVAVQGLGFVGAVMSIVCANSKADYAVLGIDLANENNYWKIRSINDGYFPVISSDSNIETFFENSKKKMNFYATYDDYAYSKADVIIVDINLDVSKKNSFDGKLMGYDVDLSNFENAIKSIGLNCKEDVLILVETTVPPGTCEKVIKPIIEKSLKKRGLNHNNFKLGHSYERVMPGPNYIDSIINYFRVYSGINNVSEIETKNFLETIISTKKYPLTNLKNTNSTEYAKVLENSFRAMNIAFATEWSRFAEESNVDMYEVVDAIRMRPTHKNLMYPGIGVGGYCLTKDPLLASWSKVNHFKSDKRLDQSELGVNINDTMPLFAYNYLKKSFGIKTFEKKNILLLGASYRSDLGDTRFSPVERFYNFIKVDKGLITVHDPYVSYWEELKIGINKNLKKILEKKFDLIVFTTAHSDYSDSNILINYFNSNEEVLIYDTVGILDDNFLSKLKYKSKIKILGRGDI